MKKREIDIFGVLLGVVIGCILGFFLSTRLNIDAHDKDKDVGGRDGNIYLLQIDKVSSPDDAITIFNNLKNKGLNCVVVYVNNNYFIYGGISENVNKLEIVKEKYLEKGINTIIKKEYILDIPNLVIEDNKSFDFYTECVSNLLNNLQNKPIVISEQTRINPVNIELFSAFLALDTVQNEIILEQLRLSIYEMIIESIN